MTETPDDILSPSDVAAIFKVDRKTVARWAAEGKLPSFRTLGGIRRYYRRDVDAALAAAQFGTYGGRS